MAVGGDFAVTTNKVNGDGDSGLLRHQFRLGFGLWSTSVSSRGVLVFGGDESNVGG